MSITNELPNFPQVSQLHSPTADGYPDENARWNCVPASLAAGIRYLTGAVVDPDELKDAVYGQGYTGGQAAAQYVGWMRSHGVDLVPVNDSDGAALVSYIHRALAAGHPVVATIPSQWGTAPADPLHPAGSTHVVCFYGWGPGALRAMNPWLAPTPHDGDDGYWAARLCFGQVWDVTKRAEVLAVAWTRQADGTGRDAKGNGCGVGFMNELIAKGETGSDGRMSESYVGGAQGFKSFLPLENGDVLVYDGRSVTHDGALVAAELYRLLVAARNQPPQTVTVQVPAPADPVKDKALATLQDLKAMLGEL